MTRYTTHSFALVAAMILAVTSISIVADAQPAFAHSGGEIVELA